MDAATRQRRAPDLALNAEATAPTPTMATQQIRLLFVQGVAGHLFTLGVAATIVWLSWRVVPTPILVTWFVVLLAVSFARYCLLRQFHSEVRSDADLPRWCRLFTAGVAAGGIALGCAGFFAHYGGLEYQIVITFILGGLALGAVPILSPVLNTYAIYVAGVLSPTLIWHFSQGTQAKTIMGVVGMLFCLALLATARFYNRALSRTFALAQENTELTRGLHSERAVSGKLREREIQLERNEARLKDFADMGADLFWEADSRMHYTYLSEGYERLAGIAPEQLIGQSVMAPNAPCFLPPEWFDGNDVRKDEFLDHSVTWVQPSGRNVVLLSNGQPIFEDRKFLGFRGTARDITEQHRLAEQLTFQASHDSLTQLVNRREFEQRLQRALSSTRSTGAPHVVCYLDLDQFKIVNDTCGHAAGDRLLIQVADLLQQQVRGRDTVARLGGDEFALLFEHCTPADGLAIVQNLHSAITAHRFQWQQEIFHLGASIGLVPVESTSESVERIMLAADTACYEAKHQGRNRIQVGQSLNPERIHAYAEGKWVSRINQAIENGRFVLARQPIRALRPEADSSIEHFEFLLRMYAEDDSLILPGAFLPAAERLNLASKIDAWVVQNALAWLGNQSAGASQLCCSINLSGQSLMADDFLALLLKALEETNVPAKTICFEITETAAITNFTAASRFIQQLSQRGCKFALDDFGAGLSSFGYLKHLPVDFLKIDGQFVRDIVSDPTGLAVVRSINELGHIMGKQTIAEYVENDELLEIVRDLGVDYAQGYAIGAPELVAL